MESFAPLQTHPSQDPFYPSRAPLGAAGGAQKERVPAASAGHSFAHHAVNSNGIPASHSAASHSAASHHAASHHAASHNAMHDNAAAVHAAGLAPPSVQDKHAAQMARETLEGEFRASRLQRLVQSLQSRENRPDPDYVNTMQAGAMQRSWRRKVAEWLLEFVEEFGLPNDIGECVCACGLFPVFVFGGRPTDLSAARPSPPPSPPPEYL